MVTETSPQGYATSLLLFVLLQVNNNAKCNKSNDFLV